MWSVYEAVAALRSCQPVLIYDSAERENEVDMVFHSSCVDRDVVYTLRTVAGGLICFTMPHTIAKLLGIKFLAEYLRQDPSIARLTMRKPSYGDEPAFSLWVNHVSVRTGISDEDRALTISRLYHVVELAHSGRWWDARNLFLEEFMAPGHVPILIGRPIDLRRGHTELSLALAILAGLPPSTTIAEILSKYRSATVEEARKLAHDLGAPLIDSSQIIAAVRTLGSPHMHS